MAAKPAARFRLPDAETRRRFAKFVVLGAVNTVFGYAVYAALVLGGLGAQMALLLSFSIGVMFNYILSARFIFATRGFKRLPAYAFTYAGVYALNAISLAQLTRWGTAPLLAQAILTPIAAVLTFVLVSRVMRTS